MADYVVRFIELVSTAMQGLAAVIVAYGAVIALYYIVLRCLREDLDYECYTRARVRLGRRLVVGLEFLLGADILRTAISPTWNQIGIVAAIVVLRSALSLLLEREIERLEQQVESH